MQSDSQKLIAVLAAKVAEKLERRLQELIQNEPWVLTRLLNVAQASRYLGRSKGAIRHLIARRALPVVRVGKRVQLDRFELDAFIEKHRSS
ncbi:MAG TPA: helix-turn-helix domain-containing protein [Candidatus Angelobacter sp.]|nr:helix-turn-helix domain-containing protein [Candidatus Angelobacter sp.]